MNPTKAVVLLSGGLDSSTVAAIAKADGYKVVALSFRYGQRHERELQASKTVASLLEITEHFIVDVNLAQWGGSALTDQTISVPTDGVEVGVIPTTYVPGRNTVFIAIALSLAEASGAEAIYLGINAVDYSGYPDCRPEYLATYQQLAERSSKVGLEGKAPRLVAPLVMDSKVDIVRRALQLGYRLSQLGLATRETKNLVVCVTLAESAIALLIEVGRPDLATTIGRSLR